MRSGTTTGAAALLTPAGCGQGSPVPVGTMQVTLAGRPLHRFVDDGAPGDGDGGIRSAVGAEVGP
jgi:hypothetical protein